jgi:hypothetical protein
MQRFQVIFEGEFFADRTPEKAVALLAQHFRLAPALQRRLLAGERLVLKQGLDETTAARYCDAAARCGVVFNLEADPAGTPIPSPPPARAPEKPFHVSCPVCGMAQVKASTCLQCGAFLTAEPAPRHSLAPPPPAAKPSRGGGWGLFKTVRVTLLLLILAAAALHTWMTRVWTTDWQEPLWVAVYPIDAEDSPRVSAYLERLTSADFQPVADFFARQAKAHGLALEQPFKIDLAPAVASLPPPPPAAGNPLQVAWWSLRLRWWARSAGALEGPAPDIRVFVLYHEPTAANEWLDNSFALPKGLIGMVHAYATPALAPRNQVIIAHEILHTLGARDKYDPATGLPLHPAGFAEPYKTPLYPQAAAEIMAGRIPWSEVVARMPASLEEVTVGAETTREIRWTD